MAVLLGGNHFVSLYLCFRIFKVAPMRVPVPRGPCALHAGPVPQRPVCNKKRIWNEAELGLNPVLPLPCSEASGTGVLSAPQFSLL